LQIDRIPLAKVGRNLEREGFFNLEVGQEIHFTAKKNERTKSNWLLEAQILDLPLKMSER